MSFRIRHRHGVVMLAFALGSISAAGSDRPLSKIVFPPCEDGSPYRAVKAASGKLYTLCEFNDRFSLNIFTPDFKTIKTFSSPGRFLGISDRLITSETSSGINVTDIWTGKTVKELRYHNSKNLRYDVWSVLDSSDRQIIILNDPSKKNGYSYISINDQNRKVTYSKISDCPASRCDFSYFSDGENQAWLGISAYDIESGAVTVMNNVSNFVIAIPSNSLHEVSGNVIAISNNLAVTKSSSFFGCDPSRTTISLDSLSQSKNQRPPTNIIVDQHDQNPCNDQLADVKDSFIDREGVTLFTSNRQLKHIFSPKKNNLSSFFFPDNYYIYENFKSKKYIVLQNQSHICIAMKSNIEIKRCIKNEFFKLKDYQDFTVLEDKDSIYTFWPLPIHGGSKESVYFTKIR